MNLLFVILDYAMSVRQTGREAADRRLSAMVGNPSLEEHVRPCVDDAGRLVDEDGEPVSLMVADGIESNLAEE